MKIDKTESGGYVVEMTREEYISTIGMIVMGTVAGKGKAFDAMILTMAFTKKKHVDEFFESAPNSLTPIKEWCYTLVKDETTTPTTSIVE